MDALLLTDADLLESTPLGGNIDPDKYRLCVNDAQVSKLEEILGETIGTHKRNEIEKVIDKALKEYGEVFKKLSKE